MLKATRDSKRWRWSLKWRLPQGAAVKITTIPT